MNRLLKLKLWALAALIGFGAVAQTLAGAEGHGGGAWVGPGDQVELLDTWEGRAIFGQEYDPNMLPTVDAWLAYAVGQVKRIDERFGAKIESVIARIRTRFRDVGTEVALAAPRDAFNDFQKPGATLVGAANFEDLRDILWVDTKLVVKMPVMETAALLFHEALYSLLRGHEEPFDGDTEYVQVYLANSQLARRWTAAAFAKTPIESPETGIPTAAGTDGVVCEFVLGPTLPVPNRIYMFRNPFGQIVFQVTKHYGIPTLGAVSVILDPKRHPITYEQMDALIRQDHGFPWQHDKDNSFVAENSLSQYRWTIGRQCDSATKTCVPLVTVKATWYRESIGWVWPSNCVKLR